MSNLAKGNGMFRRTRNTCEIGDTADGKHQYVVLKRFDLFF